MLKGLLEKEIVTLEELEIIEEDMEVLEVQDNGLSGASGLEGKHWYTVILEDREYDVYI